LYAGFLHATIFHARRGSMVGVVNHFFTVSTSGHCHAQSISINHPGHRTGVVVDFLRRKCTARS
jgi:hypothetical protein